MPINLSEKNYAGDSSQHDRSPLRQKIFLVIFGTSTPLGKLFDVVLLILILVSVLAVMLESVSYVNIEYGFELRIIEWIVTGFFTIEYFTRIYVVKKPAKYIFSAFGIVDLLSIVPTFLSLIIVGSQSFAILRALRLLRVFRVLKLMRFVNESQALGRALVSSRHKIVVFFLFVLIIVFIMGTIMYLVEGPEHGFSSIPTSIYWAIVTLTTVGFGDITPTTVAGQMIASVIMLLGYSIIAIPTGIVGAEIYREVDGNGSSRNLVCPSCGADDHRERAKFCYRCAGELKTNKALQEETNNGK